MIDLTRVLPPSWILIELGELATVHYGKALAAGVRASTGKVPVIGSSGVVGHHDEALVDGPCLVVGRKGAAGSVHFVGESSWPIDTAYFVQPPPDIDLFYLSHLLSISRLGLLDKSTAIPSLSRDDLYRVRVPIAPRAEQSRIVAKLEELLSDLDAGVAELNAAQKKLAQYRQSLLKAAVEGALTAEWRKARQQRSPDARIRVPQPAEGKSAPSGEHVHEDPDASIRATETDESGAQLLQRILQERRARWETKQLAKFAEQGKTPPKDWQSKYPEPVQPDTTDLPELPEGWVWASGEQLCEFITKGTTPPKELDSGAERTIPFLRVTNLTDRGELDLADKVFVAPETHQGFLARSTVYPNDVLMNIVGPPLGQVSVVPETFDEWNINQAIAIFRAVEGVLPWFICRYLLSPGAQRWLKARSKTTAGQTNLTLEVCRGLPIPLPPKDEQQALLASLEMALSSLEHQSNAIDLCLKQATAQRQNILRAAFAGQLVPQDPNDEPASVLLARIRAERAARGLDKGARARGGRKVVDNFGLSHPNSEKV
ncbi:MAG: restriction endonuclease subunit S [Proteobacteria bacterium]|nr:restriction endonuclease subunit S [Pseudomonadota bacterium]